MNSKIIRHQRVVNVRAMILEGKDLNEIYAVLAKMKVAKATAQGYIDEAVMDILRKQKK
jgi:hypothetical protein